jgi:hypothetical protein
MKANTARFSQMFGKMRRYRQRMLYLSSSSSKPQKMLAM